MACDMVVAGDNAQFGQPEIRLGVIPGAGGTQRLTRAIGKARAMELILTGRRIGARRGRARWAWSSMVVPAAETLDRALDLAGRIAAQPPLAVAAAKAAVVAAQALPLAQGLRFERERFEALFETEDQREGMIAFLEKRPPTWTSAADAGPAEGATAASPAGSGRRLLQSGMARHLDRSLRQTWIIDAVRTPIGRYGGALGAVRPDDLAALVIRAIVDRTGIDPAVVEDVILGCANQAGEDNRNVARMAALLAGLPVEVAGQTVNRLCGSGLQAVNSRQPRDRRGRRRRVHRRRRGVHDAGPRT